MNYYNFDILKYFFSNIIMSNNNIPSELTPELVTSVLEDRYQKRIPVKELKKVYNLSEKQYTMINSFSGEYKKRFGEKTKKELLKEKTLTYWDNLKPEEEKIEEVKDDNEKI